MIKRLEYLIFERIIFQNGQAHFKNLAINAVRLLKCVWAFGEIIH